MTPTEKTVSAICAGILGLDGVEAEDDLYDLGSDSTHAVLVALEIERVFAVDMPLEVMETSATVRALSAWIDDGVARREAGAASRGGAAGDV